MEYFDRKHLKDFNKGIMREDSSENWDNFMKYYGGVFCQGALTEREKQLIALAVAHAIHCPYCIEAYTEACLSSGCSKEEMTEAVHVASALSAGAILANGVMMKTYADEVEF